MRLKSLRVQSAKHPYLVHFEEDFAASLQEHLRPGDLAVVDATVLRLYQEKLAPLLRSARHVVVEPSEERKSYQGVEPFIARLIETGFRKNNRLIAIGGGITQDITAFTASILFRGVDWLFYPTTLLAQCDSCIGSKTSINFKTFKNQLGNFYPPREVIIDHRFLETLSPLDFRSGMGEMVHYYLVAGEEDFQRMLSEYERAFDDKAVLHELIYHCLDFKRGYVERDEFDEGPRNVFNYGHSFGHAIESLTEYAVPHGIAVSIGMDIANELSVRLGFLSAEWRERMRVLLKKNWGETRLSGIAAQDIISALSKDKKNAGAQLRVILTRGPGQMFKTPLSVTREVGAWIEQYLEAFSREAPDHA